MTGLRDQRQPVIAIAAILRDEHPDILEWIAYHRVLGVSRFFISDDRSADGTSELLCPKGRDVVVDQVPLVTESNRSIQLSAYEKILDVCPDAVDWLALIDADAFLFPTDGARSLLPFIVEFDELPQAGAMAVNWTIYESSRQAFAEDRLVIERFAARGQQSNGVNTHYRCFGRISSNSRVSGNPHAFLMQPGYETLSTSKACIVDGIVSVTTLTVNWDRVRINHYVVKSYEEFLLRKRPRGRVSNGQL